MERKFEHLIEGKRFKNFYFYCKRPFITEMLDSEFHPKEMFAKIYPYVLHIIVIIAETQAAEI